MFQSGVELEVDNTNKIELFRRLMNIAIIVIIIPAQKTNIYFFPNSLRKVVSGWWLCFGGGCVWVVHKESKSGMEKKGKAEK